MTPTRNTAAEHLIAPPAIHVGPRAVARLYHLAPPKTSTPTPLPPSLAHSIDRLELDAIARWRP